MPEKTPEKIAVGIDLGTTYSTISYIDEHGKPVCIENSIGQILTPSAVCLEATGIVVGSDAVKSSAFSPDKYFECFKREMGENKRFLCNGVETPPEVLSALVLEKLKADAEKRIGPFKDAVITVPAYFDENRRQATVVAAELAGINVLEIINEPTAAAVAFGVNQGPDCNKTILVYDLGGGTFDVSILKIENGNFTTIATDGDVQLGGKDFDERLINFLAEEFEKEHGVDPRQNSSDLSQLWCDAEETKRSLSEREEVPHVMFFSGHRHRVNVTRQKFNDLTADLVRRTGTTAEMLLREIGMTWDGIDDLLVVGGSSRIPAVREMLTSISGKEPNYSMNPDQVVGHGAALLCHSLTNAKGDDQFSLVDVNSRSLGVIGIDPQTKEKFNHIVIPKNTPLPFNATEIFVTGKIDQASVAIPVVEGESRRPEECVQIGKCSVRDLPRGLPVGTKIQVHFAYDSSGRLEVSARIPVARQSAATVIDRKTDRERQSLGAWKDRLTGKPVSQKNEPTSSDNLTRLDALFQEIASTSSSGDPKIEKRISQLRKDLEAKRKKHQEAQQKQANSPNRAEAVQYSSILSKLSKGIASIEAEIKFTEIECGRQIVLAGKEGFGEAAQAEEARELMAKLKALSPNASKK